VDEREEILADLRERAKFYSLLTELGPPMAVPERPGPGDLRPPAVASAPSGNGLPGLDDIRAEVGDCQRCKLAPTRKTIVFGQGNPNARLAFVGEAPGADEDEQGLAFVGKAGQLLTKIIEAIGMTRNDVWIGNILMCRPPNNRNPEPDEILACQAFLERKLEAIHPKVIVGLGKFAGQWLLKTMEPISRIRGRVGDYKGIKVVPTYHPAYLLRNPGAKRDVWEDMKLVRSLLAE
jgi:DNA polymerase